MDGKPKPPRDTHYYVVCYVGEMTCTDCEWFRSLAAAVNHAREKAATGDYDRAEVVMRATVAAIKGKRPAKAGGIT